MKTVTAPRAHKLSILSGQTNRRPAVAGDVVYDNEWASPTAIVMDKTDLTRLQ
jgi:hypothetical protein